MQAWVVRSGGQNEPDVSHLFEANSVAAISWRDTFGDLSGMSREEIRLAGAVTGATARIIDRFVNEIEIGDLIVTPPSADRGPVLIGYCEGQYEYRPGLIEIDGDPYKHVRAVRWLKKVPRSGLSGAFTKSLLPTTVFNVSKHLEEIQRVIGAADTPVRDVRWDEFVGWAKRFWEWEQFDANERENKLEMGRNLAGVKEALLDGDAKWEEQLNRVLTSANLTDWRVRDSFLKQDRPLIEEALRRIWGMDAPVSLARIHRKDVAEPAVGRKERFDADGGWAGCGGQGKGLTGQRSSGGRDYQADGSRSGTGQAPIGRRLGSPRNQTEGRPFDAVFPGLMKRGEARVEALGGYQISQTAKVMGHHLYGQPGSWQATGGEMVEPDGF